MLYLVLEFERKYKRKKIKSKTKKKKNLKLIKWFYMFFKIHFSYVSD